MKIPKKYLEEFRDQYRLGYAAARKEDDAMFEAAKKMQEESKRFQVVKSAQVEVFQAVAQALSSLASLIDNAGVLR